MFGFFIVSNLSQLLYIFYVDRQNLYLFIGSVRSKAFLRTILDTLYRGRFGQKHIESVVQGFVDIIQKYMTICFVSNTEHF